MGVYSLDDSGRPAPRVLVVEDEALIALDLEVRLERLGYRVVGTADEADAACELALREEPDVVLMDIRLRGERDGIDAAEMLRAHSGVPVVFLTSHADDATIAATERASPYGYVLKPFDERTLVATIETALRRHAHDRKFRLLSAAMESATIGILLVELDAACGPRIVSANPAFAKLAGHEIAEILGRRPCFLARSPDAEGPQRLAAALESATPAEVEIEGRRPDGSSFWSRVTISPFAERHGRPSHVMIFHADITPLRSAEASLSALQRLELQSLSIDSFVHDFKDLLSIISNGAELLAEPCDGGVANAVLADILASTRRGAALVAQLAELGGADQQLAVCDVGHIVRSTQNVARRVLGPHGRIRVEGRLESLRTAMPPSNLQQALVIVLLHLQGRASGGEMTLRLTTGREKQPDGATVSAIRLEVHGQHTDAPRSAPPAERDGASHDRVALAHRLLRGAGGWLLIPADRSDGLLATLVLPEALEQESPEAETVIPTTRVSVDGAPCILVQTDPALRRATARSLQTAGFDVRAAAAVDAALAQWHQRGPPAALVVLDATTPGYDVDTALRELRAIGRCHNAVVIQSADSRVDATPRPDTQVIWKPYSTQTLLRAVAELLAPTTLDDAAGTPVQDRPPTPAAPPLPRRRSSTVDLVSKPAPSTILLVEDDALPRRTMTMVLRRAGFEVVTATSLSEGLDALETMPCIDACVSDIELGDGEGFALAERLRVLHPHVPFVIVSGSDSPLHLRHALRVRAVAHLAKPVEADTLVREVTAAVQEGELQRLQAELLTERLGQNSERFVPSHSGVALSEALVTLRMAYQPIVQAHGGTVVGYEALMRPQPKLFRSPPLLLNTAEFLGRTLEVGRVTRGLIAETIFNDPANSSDFFVNLHPLELRAEVLLAPDEPLLQFADRVVLEVTERAKFAADQDVTTTLAALRKQGFRIAVDDLGEGYAGLSWLLRMQPDVAKLDISLVRDIDQSRTQRRLVASLVGFCRRSGIRILAEGIERAEEAVVLTDLGCELLQGYYFGRPAFEFDPASGPRRTAS
jgi:PAS domain S-box-containing protein